MGSLAPSIGTVRGATQTTVRIHSFFFSVVTKYLAKVQLLVTKLLRHNITAIRVHPALGGRRGTGVLLSPGSVCLPSKSADL